MRKSNVILLVGGQLFSVLATSIIQFVLSLCILDLTGSASLFSLILSLSVIGKLLGLPFSGILADRIRKKILLFNMNIVYLVLTIILIIFLKNEFIVYLSVIFLGLVSSFETPIVQSTIPLIEKKASIPRTNSIVSGIGILGTIVSPILVGIFYGNISLNIIFFSCVVFLVLAVVCIIFLRINQNVKKSNDSIIDIVIKDNKEILEYLKVNKLIAKVAFLSFFLNAVVAAFIEVVIPYTTKVLLRVSNFEYGFMNASFALGSIIGLVIYGIVYKRMSFGVLTNLLLIASILFILMALPFLINNQGKVFYILIFINMLILIIFAICSIYTITYVQLHTDKNILGRILSFIMLVSTLALPLGQLVYGRLGEIINLENIQYLIIAVGMLLFIMSLVAKKMLLIK